MNPIVKIPPPFHMSLFWTYFIVKKIHHKNKYLGLLILNLYPTSKYLYKNNGMMLTYSIKHFFPSFNTITKKEQANNFVLWYLWYLYFIKKEQAIAYNHSMYRLLIIIHISNKCFENTFFEGALLKITYVLKCIFWGSNYLNFLIHGCCSIFSWLLISVVALLYFLLKSSPQAKFLQF